MVIRYRGLAPCDLGPEIFSSSHRVGRTTYIGGPRPFAPPPLQTPTPVRPSPYGIGGRPTSCPALPT